MLPPRRRLARALKLIDQEKYFVLRAGRQTGKTTSARWMVEHLRKTGRYEALWVDLQTARELSSPADAFPLIFNAFTRALKVHPSLPTLPEKKGASWLKTPGSSLVELLAWLSSKSKKPLVLFLDEVDGLVGQTMVSFLTQLRDLYIGRPQQPAPHSLVLVGQRSVRDYILTQEERNAVAWLGTTSPFNITAETQTLEPFSQKEVRELLLKHTKVTGQKWSKKATARVYELGQGHPWLTNALAEICVERLVENRSKMLKSRHVEEAKELMIQERRTHIDSLIARLREERVKRIVAPMIVGETTSGDVVDDDFAYVLGLGLLTRREGSYQVANPIYREVIPRVLTHDQQLQIPNQTSWYVKADGKLDMPRLMAAWQEFWREDGHLAAEGFHYREAGPHLMLMAFLQRVLNGGGRLDREYALGRGALDLLVTWKGERHAIEVKVRRDERTEGKAVEQVGRYLESLGLKEGWVVLFDRRTTVGWEEKMFQREHRRGDTRVIVLGC
jgi:hypothetical protein